MKFIDKLLEANRKNNSWLCIGLDPDPELMPGVDVLRFNKAIIEATSDLVCAYKPNLAFYEALGTEGLTILEKTVRHVSDDIPVIADAKRGDIGNTARAYARALFSVLGFDAATVSPYLGHDSVEVYLSCAEHQTRELQICRTFRPTACVCTKQ
jgi:orotidine-5'-phosphate decarboxylase